MPPFDIPGARGRGNPRPKRRTTPKRRAIPTHLYTPLNRQGRRSVPRQVVTRKGRAVVTKRVYKPNPKRVISHGTVTRLQNRKRDRSIQRYYATGKPRPANVFYSKITATPLGELKGRAKQMEQDRRQALEQALHEGLYRSYAKKLWPKVRADYGLPKGTPMPKLHFPKATGGWRLEGNVFHERPKDIYVTPQVAVNAFSAEGWRRNFARSVPIHEWAHTQQPVGDRRRLPRWLIEGGAEAFSRDVERKHGMPRSTSREYLYYAGRVRKRKGASYIHRGQFGR